MTESPIPSLEDIDGYYRRKAEEAEFDTGLHATPGPPIPTADYILGGWNKAVADRIAREQTEQQGS